MVPFPLRAELILQRCLERRGDLEIRLLGNLLFAAALQHVDDGLTLRA